MEKMKILVVDDESRMRKLVRDFLEREGFQVFEAGDGMEAMDIFYENRDIALIILDVTWSFSDVERTIFLPVPNSFQNCCHRSENFFSSQKLTPFFSTAFSLILPFSRFSLSDF